MPRTPSHRTARLPGAVATLALTIALLGADSSAQKHLGTPVDRVPGTADASHRITQSGKYFLRRPLLGEPGKCGIEIEAQDVVLDLHDFRMEGAAGTLEGIRIQPGLRSLTIRNGTISDWGAEGLRQLTAGGFSSSQGTPAPQTVVDLAQVGFLDNEGDGAAFDDGGTVVNATDVTAKGNGGHGVRTVGVFNAQGVLIAVNQIDGVRAGYAQIGHGGRFSHNGGHGVFVERGIQVHDSTFTSNGGDGIRSDGFLQSFRVVSEFNQGAGASSGAFAQIGHGGYFENGNGIAAGSHSVIDGDIVVQSGGTGIQVGFSSMVKDSLVTGGDVGVKTSVRGFLDSVFADGNGTGFETSINAFLNQVFASDGSLGADLGSNSQVWRSVISGNAIGASLSGNSTVSDSTISGNAFGLELNGGKNKVFRNTFSGNISQDVGDNTPDSAVATIDCDLDNLAPLGNVGDISVGPGLD